MLARLETNAGGIVAAGAGGGLAVVAFAIGFALRGRVLATGGRSSVSVDCVRFVIPKRNYAHDEYIQRKWGMEGNRETNASFWIHGGRGSIA